jgi:hypothetical protein|tara:strand:- start:698 stop:820 length:123 start_codon:yes stop_codon:yes gene_type:complete
MNPFGGETVEMGSFEKRMPKEAHGIITMVIGEDDEDIGTG